MLRDFCSAEKLCCLGGCLYLRSKKKKRGGVKRRAESEKTRVDNKRRKKKKKSFGCCRHFFFPPSWKANHQTQLRFCPLEAKVPQVIKYRRVASLYSKKKKRNRNAPDNAVGNPSFKLQVQWLQHPQFSSKLPSIIRGHSPHAPALLMYTHSIW